MGVGRRLRVGFLATAALAAGVGCSAKPYARDPLLRDRRGVPGDRAAAARPPVAPAEPRGPEAPPGPTLGAPRLAGVTSR
jgi:hypothetical protein